MATVALRTQITGRLLTLLATITKANGYRTNIGSAVAVRERVNEGEVPSLQIVPEDERPTDEKYGASQADIEYTLVAYVDRKDESITDYSANPTAEWVICDALIADIRQRMDGRDSTLEALIEAKRFVGARPIYHQDGGPSCGAELRYNVRYLTARGLPGTAP